MSDVHVKLVVPAPVHARRDAHAVKHAVSARKATAVKM